MCLSPWLKPITNIFAAVAISSCLANAGAFAAEDKTLSAEEILTFKPKIDPNYLPKKGSDEENLWMAFDKYERALQGSDILITDPELVEYVNNMVCKLVPDYCGDIRVYITNNPHFNASMTSNGVMTIWSGLLLRAENEDQLAAIVGHELAHYLMQHGIQSWRRAKSSAATQSVFSLFGLAGLAANLLVTSSFFDYSRQQETEADLYGLQLLHQAGYKPDESAKVWRSLAEEEESADYKRKKQRFFRTHPQSETRMTTLEEESLRFKDASQKASFVEYHKAIGPVYLATMNRLIKGQLHGRAEYILKKHEQSTLPRGEFYYLKGNFLRSRNADGDIAKAVESYRLAVKHDGPTESHRDLGYALLKLKKYQDASKHFEAYLKHSPDANDRAMVEFYIQPEV